MTAILWTVNGITQASRKTGSHWFDPDTMRAFGTRVLDAVYQGPGGVFFVTGDKKYNGARGFTVRVFDPESGSVGTARDTELAGYTKAGAIRKAKELAGVPTATSHEKHKPVTVLEQFVSDLRQHGDPKADSGTAESLIGWAAKHHRMMEEDCNVGNQHDHEGNPKPWLVALRAKIIRAAQACGAVAVLFGGDPRGCTVKLTFADGYTNDFGREGYCVPTSTKSDD